MIVQSKFAVNNNIFNRQISCFFYLEDKFVNRYKIVIFVEVYFYFQLYLYFQIKPIPLPDGEVPSESNPQRFYVPTENNDEPPPLPPPSKVPKIEKKEKVRGKCRRLSEVGKTEENFPKQPTKTAPSDNICDVCQQEGALNESVR